jgi:hypothetical protein
MADMNPKLVTAVDKVESAQDVGSCNLNLMIFAPVGVGGTANAGTVENVGGVET